VWMPALGKILTLDNLRKRRVIVVEWCCMCWSGESIDHLFLHCEVEKELWSSIFSLFRVKWVMPKRVIELLDCCRG
jgi:hypothetical protein